MNRNVVVGIGLVAAAGIFWGSMGTAVQYLFSLDDRFTALALVTYRQLAAGILFVALASVFMPGRIWSALKDKQNVIDIVISGALIFGAHYAFFESISYSNAGTAAILLTLVPLFAGVYEAVAQRRMVSLVECICFLLASAGVVLIITNGELGVLQFSPMALVWGICSALLATAYTIQPLGVIKRAGVVVTAAWGMLAGGLIASIFYPPWTLPVQIWTLPALGSFAYVVVFGTVIGFWCYLSGLKYISVVMAGLLNCMEPLSAFLFSIVLLGDS